jgi:catechol 2,3-dioxygenase-like lactoylglutathione lyase family enzyme
MTRIDHLALVVDDPTLAAKWYEFNFDAELLYADETWAFVEFENIKMAFVKKGMHPAHFAFEVDNFENVEGSIKLHRDGSHSVYKKDPWGNIYELINYEYEE